MRCRCCGREMFEITGAMPGTKVCQDCGDAVRSLVAEQQRLGREFEGTLKEEQRRQASWNTKGSVCR